MKEQKVWALVTWVWALVMAGVWALVVQALESLYTSALQVGDW